MEHRQNSNYYKLLLVKKTGSEWMKMMSQLNILATG